MSLNLALKFTKLVELFEGISPSDNNMILNNRTIIHKDKLYSLEADESFTMFEHVEKD